MAEIISVRFRSEGKQYFFDPGELTCRTGDRVIVETANGLEYGHCTRGNFSLPETELKAPLRPVIRLATPADEETVRRNKEKEKYAFRVCQEKIADHKLDMKLVSVEVSFEGSKILFFFTSEGRVDFRGLVKSLASVFHTRIELRQIGIRDEAKLLGGLGICGRPFCCASFLRDFQPVSIKMAKTQNLSLNPTKISGTCGRLMCCLKYEQEAYESLVKDAPHQDSFVETPDGAGTIISTNILRQRVRVRLDSAPDSLKTYHNSEIRVIRSGKGKRPENYVEPPKAELEKLRKVTQAPEEEMRRAQAETAAAVNSFMDETESRPPRRSHRERPKQERPAPAAAQQAEKAEKQEDQQQSSRHRSRRRGGQRGGTQAAENTQNPPAAQRKPRPPKEKEHGEQPANEENKERRRPHWHRRSSGRRGGRKPGSGNPSSGES